MGTHHYIYEKRVDRARRQRMQTQQNRIDRRWDKHNRKRRQEINDFTRAMKQEVMPRLAFAIEQYGKNWVRVMTQFSDDVRKAKIRLALQSPRMQGKEAAFAILDEVYGHDGAGMSRIQSSQLDESGR